MGLPDDRIREIMASRKRHGVDGGCRSARRRTAGWATSSKTRPHKTPSDFASQQVMREQIDQVLGLLGDRERRVLTLRFGLEGGRVRTLEEVGREVGVTRERVQADRGQSAAKATPSQPEPALTRLPGLAASAHPLDSSMSDRANPVTHPPALFCKKQYLERNPERVCRLRDANRVRLKTLPIVWAIE